MSDKQGYVKTITKNKYDRMHNHSKAKFYHVFNGSKMRYVTGVIVQDKNGIFYYCKILQIYREDGGNTSYNCYYARYNLKEMF